MNTEILTNALGQVDSENVPDGLRPYLGAHAWLPERLPNGWTVVRECPNGRRYLSAHGLSVIASGWEVRGADGSWAPWMHLSMARKSRLPETEDIKLLLRLFVRRNASGSEAVIWLPREDEKRAGGGRVVHCFARADGAAAVDVPEMLMR